MQISLTVNFVQIDFSVYLGPYTLTTHHPLQNKVFYICAQLIPVNF